MKFEELSKQMQDVLTRIKNGVYPDAIQTDIDETLASAKTEDDFRYVLNEWLDGLKERADDVMQMVASTAVDKGTRKKYVKEIEKHIELHKITFSEMIVDATLKNRPSAELADAVDALAVVIKNSPKVIDTLMGKGCEMKRETTP